MKFDLKNCKERGDQKSFGTVPKIHSLQAPPVPNCKDERYARLKSSICSQWVLDTLKAIPFRSPLPYFTIRNIAILTVVVLLVSSHSMTTIETFAAGLKNALICSITNICNNFFCLDMWSPENGTDAKKLNCNVQALQLVGQQHISLYRRCYSCNTQHTTSFHCQDPVHFQLFRPV